MYTSMHFVCRNTGKKFRAIDLPAELPLRLYNVRLLAEN